MGPPEAQRDRIDRRQRIIDAARTLADADGWPAVTVRRLAELIGYSQPVLYGHFADGRDGIVRAVALEGFVEMAASLSEIPAESSAPERLRQTAARYLRFAREHPATYEAMFGTATDLAFATATVGPELRAAFDALAAAVDDDETRAETLWSALHGLAELDRHGRLRPDHQPARVAVLVSLFAGG